MRFRWFFVVVLITLMILTACQASDTTGSQEQPAGEQLSEEGLAVEQSTGEEQSSVNNPVTYPAPESEGAAVNPYPAPVFPDLADGEEVTWEQAREMIMNGELSVIKIISGDPEVALVLRDGRVFVVTVLDVMDIHNSLAECGESCRNVVIQQD